MAVPVQLALNLPSRPALGREDFFVGEANQAAVAMVEDWRRWPGPALALVGPAGAGKTHLAQVWAGLAGARVIPAAGLAEGQPPIGAAALAVEDADRLHLLSADRRQAAEEALFHLWNAAANTGGRLLVTGAEPPSRWAIALPDLASRLQAAGVARIEPPDDRLLAAVIVKLFADRQLRVGADVVQLILRRIERSFAAAEAAVEKLDRVALSQRRKPGIELARETFPAAESAPSAGSLS